MKRLAALMGFTVAVCALASAQENSNERVVVPARNTSHPRVVNASSNHGSITVKTYAGKEVIVETPSRGGRSNSERSVDGLRRIDLPNRGLVVEEEDNVIQVRTSSTYSTDLVISVPADTALHLKSLHGNVNVEGVRGEVEATSTNGSVTLTGISGTVVAGSNNGSIKVVMDRVDAAKPISFSTLNGNIDVTLPADIKANLKMKAVRGSIYSDFEMKLTGPQAVTSGGDKNGRYRVEFDHTMTGTINGGGVDASFYTLNGRIMIRKK